MTSYNIKVAFIFCSITILQIALFIPSTAYSQEQAITNNSSVPELYNTSATFSSSNLPIIIINTNGKVITDEPKTTASMGIISNPNGARNNITDAPNDFSGLIGIELRGNISQGDKFPKKPYGFETRDEAGVNLNVSLLGMPEENDWILNASYIDKTLLRNALALELSRKMGRYASQTRFCELVINGEYQGVYVLMEKNKQDKNRVNIEELKQSHSDRDSITGGYIYEVSQSGDELGDRRGLRYPSPSDITTKQKTYIRNYDDNFRAVMTKSYYADPLRGYPSLIDVQSFIDEILIQEACKNSDAYGWSSYFHKDRLKKLSAGPAWDFDQGLSNSTWNSGDIYDEWVTEKPNNSVPVFWEKLFNEPTFRYLLKKRWFELREKHMHTDSIMLFIDKTALYLNEGQERNFELWPSLGIELWRNTDGWESRVTYQDEVDYLKDWLQPRLEWIDNELLTVKDKTIEIPNLVISEIMYDPNDEPSTEFVEIANTNTNSVDLSGIYFDKGITFTFPSGAILEEGQSLVITADSSAFIKKYGFKPYGQYYGRLDNNGENLVLQNVYGMDIDMVRYNNANPWPIFEKNNNSSIELISTGLDNSLGDNWRAALNPMGTPVNSISTTLSNNNIKLQAIQAFPIPASDILHITMPENVEQDLTVEIFDVFGKLVLVENHQGRDLTIDVSTLKSNQYILRVVSNSQSFKQGIVILH